MADVSRDRGQLIILTGLIVAVTMVALVLLLNTAIYTENLASRGADQSGREAMEYRTVVVDDVGELIDEENAREHGSYTDVRTNVEDGIEVYDNLTAKSYATGGTITYVNQSASAMTVTRGKLVRQTNSSRRFRNESEALNDWRLASGVNDDEIRDFRLTVNQGDLNSGDSFAFNVRLDDGSNTWQAYVYDKGGSEVAVSISLDGGASTTEVCSVSAPEATVDLTRGTIEGEPCPGLDWAEGLTSDYTVEYRHGENATGTFNVTIDDTEASIESSNLDSTPSSAVYVVHAVYSASFNIVFESPSLTYETPVRVAPGEP